MTKLLKLYFSVFSYLGNISNEFKFDNNSYEIKREKKKLLVLLSFVFISIPGVVVIFCNEIIKIYNLSLTTVIMIYVSLYVFIATICGFIARYFLFKHILSKNIKGK